MTHIISSGGCDPNLSHAGVTPLQIAIESGSADIAAILLKWKANPNAPTASRAGGAGWRTGESAVMMCNRYIKQNKPTEKVQVEAAKKVLHIVCLSILSLLSRFFEKCF